MLECIQHDTIYNLISIVPAFFLLDKKNLYGKIDILFYIKAMQSANQKHLINRFIYLRVRREVGVVSA